MKSLVSYFRNSFIELGKISWPTRQQTIQLTIAVIAYSLVIGSFIGAIDLGLAEVVKKVIVKS